ncbi:probable WRKY transcription factor 39 [Oryza brachyantha]|uniref:probable WRKY transcription factor 39 n=1 Tax=Oryza brachyantha TaxID=4533 RepID=UPI001ADAD4D0|nr:probable WRKY transcription factor 39 [Oryza brachyantha]
MDGVEEANVAAVESSKKLVAILSRSGDPFRLMAAVAETDEAVSRFDRVVTILSNRVGHARARVGKMRRSSPPSVDPSCLMDHPLTAATTTTSPVAPSNGRLRVSITPPAPPSPATAARPNMEEKDVVVVAAAAAAVAPSAAKITPAVVDRSLFLETPLLDLNSCGGAPAASMAAAAAAAAEELPV